MLGYAAAICGMLCVLVGVHVQCGCHSIYDKTIIINNNLRTNT